jgi:hypothetical protein
MKPHNLVIGFGTMLVMVLTNSCGKSGHVLTVTTPTATILANPLATSTASQIVSNATPTMVVTYAPTSTKETILIPDPSATVRVIPTLAVEDARSRLIDLLANNGGCRLPCLWGITPGSTTAQEAGSILAPLSSLSDFNVFKSESGAINLNAGLKDDQLLNIAISYLANQDKVYGINFEARDMKKLVDEQSGEYSYQDVFDSSYFGEKLDFYMLHQVLATQGRPSSVLLFTWGKIPTPRYGQGNFRLILLYPEQGIAVQYTTEMRVVDKNVEGCPANAHVEMSLFPAGNAAAFDEYLAPTDWKGRIGYYKSLEEVTSLSIDDFYEIYREPTDKCLETPAHLWPIPEK